jgi:NAD(P)-dependent dehydrogenase (short-subunit alcohol dehydrogenase family)
MQLRGAVALVTGANGGLGRRLCEQLLQRGATKVYAADRVHEPGATPGAVPLHIDITDPVSVAAAAATASDVTVLVNNAGIYTSTGLLDGSFEEIRALMECHFFGTLYVTRAFAPHLINNAPGAMLNIISAVSWFHPSTMGAYASSKTALWAQTNSLREDFEARGICVTGLHVGFMDTPMVADIAAPKADPAAVALAALDGVERGAAEVLADERAREAKRAVFGGHWEDQPAASVDRAER